MNIEFFTNYYKKINQTLEKVDSLKLIEISEKINTVSKESKKIIIAGNGGSAAIASHVAVDFTKAANIRAVNFNEADLITCFANDYGYENWLVEAIRAYADEGDLLILVSSSGKSENIINAAKEASYRGLSLITLSGFAHDNPLRALGEINLWADSSEYNIVEMTHHIWLLAVVDYVIGKTKEKVTL
jgi:D-sedoheptulose 7-phosphate isomerase